MKGRTRSIAVASAVALALVGLLTVGAFAQDGGGDEGWRPPWAQDGGPGWGPPWAHGGRHFGPDPEQVLERRAEFAAALGEQLDKTPEEVEAAFRALVEERLGEAVTAERITQDEADEALAAYDKGDLRGMIWIFKDAMMGS